MLLRITTLVFFCLLNLALSAHNFNALVYMPPGPSSLNSSAWASLVGLSQAHSFSIDSTSQNSAFTATNLDNYAVVIFLNRTPASLGASEQGALEAFLQNDKGLVLLHTALMPHSGWAWWDKAATSYLSTQMSSQMGDVIVADRAHPSTLTLPQVWAFTDSWYNVADTVRGKAHVLATLEEKSVTGGTNGFDHPVSWAKEYAGGRVWATTLGGDIALYQSSFFMDHLTGGIEWAAKELPGDAGATIDQNYDITVLDGMNTDPMALDVADDGRVFFIEKNGSVKAWKPSTGSTVLVGSVPVFPGGENGMMGMALAPGFPTPPYIYLHYTYQDGNWGNTGGGEQRVARFKVNGDVLDMSSEEILFTYNIERAAEIHSSGCLDFDADGNLFIATGDNTSYGAGASVNPYNPIDERTGNDIFDAQRSSGNTNDMRGKIMRITPSDSIGGGYTIPAGNLFPATDSTLGEIYIMGVRNPFRMKVDTATGWVYWGDVGPDAIFSDPNRGPIGKDEFNQAKGPGNFGWPYFAGDNTPYNDYDFVTSTSGALFDPANPFNDSPNNSGKQQLPPAQPALMWMDKNTLTPEFPEFYAGSATAMVGDVYQFTPASTSQARLPEYFDKKLFIMDWTRNFVKEVVLDPNGNVLKINPFLESHDWLRPMDLKVGPDGCIYSLEWDLSWGGAANPNSRISRICYAPGARSPKAIADADVLAGPAPLTVQFDAANSTDPAGLALGYEWDFGDGSAVDTTINPSHTYSSVGVYTVRLTVTNAESRRGNAVLTITAGNSAPEVSIIEPEDGTFYDWFDSVAFVVRVVDNEDGTTDDGSIPCTDLDNQTLLGHDGHAHPSAILNLCEGAFFTPSGGHSISEDEVFYLFEATYTDRGLGGSGKLRGSQINLLHPRLKQAEHFTASHGIQVIPTADLESISDIADIDDGDFIAFEPMNFKGVRNVKVRYASGGPGGVMEIHKGIPNGAATLAGSGNLRPTGSWTRYLDAKIPVRDLGGTDTYYFVFKNPNQPNSLFRINEFYFGTDSLIIIPTDLEVDQNDKFLRVYPNPTNDRLWIELNTLEAGVSMQLLDLQGKVQQQNVLDGNVNARSRFAIEMRDLTDGIYVLILENGGRKWYRKVVKK